MDRKKLDKELRKVVYHEEVRVVDSSLDSPVGNSDEEGLTLLDTLGFEEHFEQLLDDRIVRELIIFSLPERQQVEVLILRQFGYRYWEIKRLLRLRSYSQYYQIFNRLRLNYLEILQKLEKRDGII